MKHFPPKRRYKKNFSKILSFKKLTRQNPLIYGRLGLQVLEYGNLSNSRIFALQKTLTYLMQRKGRIWLRVYPIIPKTKKPLEVRMGKGKGNVTSWEAVVTPGTVLFEVTSSNIKLIKDSLLHIQKKLGLKSKLISRNDEF